jgi:transcription elongation factor GreA
VPEKNSYLTKDGFAGLEAELQEISTIRRPGVAERIRKAIEVGGVVDNAEYDDAKKEQAFIEGRNLTLERIIGSAVIIGGDNTYSDRVQIGDHVVLLNQSEDEEQYTIVGSTEADPSRGLISNESPVGRALLNKKVGEEVQVKTLAGTVTLTISSIG